MKLRHAFASAAALAALSLPALQARAANCNPAACTSEILSNAVVVNDIFHDTNGHDAFSLPIYGSLYNRWQGCPQEVPAACAGTSLAPYNCPGQYSCASPAPTFDNARQYLDQVDHLWWQPCRLGDPTLVDIGGGQICPANWGCIADGLGGNYFPWQGLMFDLHGPSNQVAIFAQNDHGPQPCESLEYTVFLTDDPSSTEVILHPATEGVDPHKWNRAVLSKIFTWGFFNTRAPDPVNFGVTCGDTNEFAVEDDSFVQVFSLPCGITFRYASIVAGNDGLDFPNCVYDSNEAELDAVAGLTESGAGVCEDADLDHYVTCACANAPLDCDCDDHNDQIHPGAPEPCDATVDLDCNQVIGTACDPGFACYQSVCVPTCSGSENSYCPSGFTCTSTATGYLCVPDNCGCVPGQICVNSQCVDACSLVTCPGEQVCQDGHCVDPCANITCPPGQSCDAGVCVAPCHCYQGNVGCIEPGTVCDSAGSDECVPPLCVGVTCNPGETCDGATGLCVGFCNANVHCPEGQKCVVPDGCVPLCDGVNCNPGLTCDPATGNCLDTSCDNITCFAPQVCLGGQCVDLGTGGSGGGGNAGGSNAGGAGANSGGPGNDPVEEGGCGCRAVGSSTGGSLAALALGLLGLAAFAGRRRR